MRNEDFWLWYEEFAAPKLATIPSMDRSGTFRKMFEHLDNFNRPVHIVETGCMEDPDNWGGNGCSTILFNEYRRYHKGSTFCSIELDQDKVDRARKLCPGALFYVGDSVEQLKKIVHRLNRIDLLYLDASQHNWLFQTPSQAHHYNELMAAMPELYSDSLVVVDDSVIALDDYPQNKVIGKGGLVAEYAFEIGARMRFCDYQVGFTNMTGRLSGQPNDTDEIKKILHCARKLVEHGDMPAADRLYRLGLHLTPKPFNAATRVLRSEAYVHFARYARATNKFATAIDLYNRGLEADPRAVEYRCEMARTMMQLGAMRLAKRHAIVATAIAPEDPGTWSTLGGIEADQINEEGCIYAYDKQIEAADKVEDIEQRRALLSIAYRNRATIALDMRDHETTIELCDKIIALDCEVGNAYHILAMLEYRQANHEKAIELFDKALANGCSNQPLTHWNKALPMESIGLLKASRAEHAWGEKEQTVQALYIPQHRFTWPKWRGEGPVTDGRKTIIHMHTEAGFGDNLSVARYFDILIRQGYEIHYETDIQLLDLFQYSFPDVKCMLRAQDYPGALGLLPFDYHMPMGDLVTAMGTDIDTIPWEGPYLKADPELSAKFASKLSKSFFNVGLCWSSGIRVEQTIWLKKYGRMKSMHFDDVRPIVKFLDPEKLYNVVSLQVGDGREEPNGYIEDLLSQAPTFAETAALIDNLDLVITVDTAVAHLAGAMGKPCWVMMQRDGASWHFMCYRPGAPWNEASPWYPSIRIFRQHEFNTPGKWDDVVNDVVVALNKLLFKEAAKVKRHESFSLT